MTGYLKRLISSLGAYQVSGVVARVIETSPDKEKAAELA